MNPSAFVVCTANILGTFVDPFEFAGNYGPEINPVRSKVFELVISQEALARNASQSRILEWMHNEEASENEIKSFKQILIDKGMRHDREHGPLLSDIATEPLLELLKQKQKIFENEGFDQKSLSDIICFVHKFGHHKIFYFLRNNPSFLLSLDKALINKASQESDSFDLPILSSTAILEEKTAADLKNRLLDKLFTPDVFKLTRDETFMKTSINQLPNTFLEPFFGKEATLNDLQAFSSKAGQVFFYWLYQSLNLQLISSEEGLITQVNKVKEIFAKTLGNPEHRALVFKDKLIESKTSVLFTQESDHFLAKSLSESFLPINSQNFLDGTLVFLKADSWEPDYEWVKVDEYEGFHKGKINLVLATNKQTGGKFLLASAHGNSTNPEDGRQQISFIMQKFKALQLVSENRGLQLIIGIDANTKSEEDVEAFRAHLDSLGLVATSVGPTTVKERMVTVQHTKAGREASDQEDFIITQKKENGGAFSHTYPTVGFKTERPDLNVSLPNMSNPSDHYPVGVTLEL